MRTPISGTQFRRDVKLAQKRGKDMAKLREVILLLIEGNPLPVHYKDHPLGGEWRHYRDCHIEPDWHRDACGSVLTEPALYSSRNAIAGSTRMAWRAGR